MKKIASILILIGLLCFAGIIYISAESNDIPGNIATIGFIVIGYFGVIIFSYGWLKRTKEKKNEVN